MIFLAEIGEVLSGSYAAGCDFSEKQPYSEEFYRDGLMTLVLAALPGARGEDGLFPGTLRKFGAYKKKWDLAGEVTPAPGTTPPPAGAPPRPGTVGRTRRHHARA